MHINYLIFQRKINLVKIKVDDYNINRVYYKTARINYTRIFFGYKYIYPF